ncbi:hypothetical protein P6709_14785 [Jeotgalibacillus sp. ET6]|uniref:hypothetical protein n=1 Tax=Jeotgalibacillus sp. ET6 TaxID=3037260 RepID=UPI002418509C|nr:hypothetical protein [Jeotgalibacillus sp. ET6]MDG5473018.1 hypothetical protein [Jeotgalibacillus sp. ET6]
MGYIAPVNNYQYQQYAERDVIKDYDPFYLTPVQRVSPYRSSGEESENLQSKDKELHANRTLHEADSGTSKVPDEKFLSMHVIPKYTGKGRLFNASV